MSWFCIFTETLTFPFSVRLFASSPMMKWVDLMNNIRASAEEIVFNDLIYA
ncbi:TnpV protein [Lactococcus lactis]|nr:TnpV protein [Lactococcus lactis]RQE17467.1 TnpV protein [Lactococcus lactis]RQE21957.1 TnpV protein [Lactococcus lactis]RQE28126.1 TnpV protein [Lactococcus lactis]